MKIVINWQDVKVLCKGCNARSCHIRESIWIRKRAPNTMNRDEGPTFSVCTKLSIVSQYFGFEE